MKIIFLDIDGVLVANRHLAQLPTRHPDDIPNDTAAILREIITATGAQIVVSSTWRLNPGCKGFLAAAGISQLHTDWRTDTQFVDDGTPERGAQIQRWLDAHPDVSQFVIIDDDTDMLRHQRPHLVRTNSLIGLTAAHQSHITQVLDRKIHRVAEKVT